MTVITIGVCMSCWVGDVEVGFDRVAAAHVIVLEAGHTHRGKERLCGKDAIARLLNRVRWDEAGDILTLPTA